jgi:tetratricopeptide (TPR) repeat protein
VPRATGQTAPATSCEARGEDRNDELSYLVARRFSDYVWEPKYVVPVWSALAKNPVWSVRARIELGNVLTRNGRYAEAAAAYEEAAEQAFACKQYVRLGWQASNAFRVARGEGGLQAFIASVRERALASDDHQTLVMAAELELNGNDARAMDAFFARIPPTALEDAEVAMMLASAAQQIGRVDLAARALQPLLERDVKGGEEERLSSDLLGLASTIAEQQGRLEDAAKLWSRALDAEADQPMDLATLRMLEGRRLDLLARVALARPQTQRSAAVDDVLAAARAWRALDADYAEIDTRLADLFFALGDRDQAWRTLSSIIDRHPGEGASYGLVAQSLERQGEVEHAQALWQLAAELEPTNPTWSLGQARNALARGHKDAARELLKAIVKGKWHERFWQQTRDAQQILNGLE